MRRRVSNAHWLVRSLVAGRLYFADGCSEQMPRSFIWGSLRPRPGFWLERHLMRAMPWSVDNRTCGCVYWFGKSRASCFDHFREEFDLPEDDA